MNQSFDNQTPVAPSQTGQNARPPIESLIDSLSHQEPGIRHQAVKSLIATGLHEIRKPLIALLGHADTHTRKLAAETLVAAGWTPQSDSEYAAFLAAKQQWQKLEQMGTVAIDALSTILQSRQPSLRKHAVSLLKAIGTEKAKVALLPILADKERALRLMVRQHLQGFVTQDLELLDPLLNLLSIDNREVLDIVIESLGAIEDTKALKPLVELKKSNSYDLSKYLEPSQYEAHMEKLSTAIHRIKKNIFTEDAKLICERCLVPHKYIQIQLEPSKSIGSYCCPRCLSNYHGVEKIVLVMDTFVKTVQESDEITALVNWYTRSFNFLYHEIWIKYSNDSDIKELISQIIPLRWDNIGIDYITIPVYIFPNIELSYDTMQLLKNTFEKVETKESAITTDLEKRFFYPESFEFPGFEYVERQPLATLQDELKSRDEKITQDSQKALEQLDWEAIGTQEAANISIALLDWSRLLSLGSEGLEVIVEEFKINTSPEIDARLQDIILRFPPPIVTKTLLEEMEFGNADDRQKIARLLDRMNWTPVTNREKIIYYIARQQCELLPNFGEESVEPFLDFLEANNLSVCQRALELLKGIDHPWVLAPLLTLAKKKGKEYLTVRETARREIIELARPEMLEAFLNEFRYQEGESLNIVIEGLGIIGDTKALRFLHGIGTKDRAFPGREDLIKTALERIKEKIVPMDNNQGMVCKKCYRYYKEHRYKIPFAPDINMYTCSGCHSNSFFITGVERIVLVMDESLDVPEQKEDGTITIHWNHKKEPVDFDEIQITHATDDDIEQMMVKLLNDSEKSTYLRNLKEVPVYISPQLELSRNTLNLLKDRFLVKMEDRGE